MSQNMNLKELEKRAFRSTFQDGLWDIYIGLLMLFIGLMFNFQDSEEIPFLGFGLIILGIGVAFAIFWFGKKYITVPRLGLVKFGAARKRKKRTLAIVMGVLVLLTLGLSLLTAAANRTPELRAAIDAVIPPGIAHRLFLASIVSLLVGSAMILVAYYNDVPRGYYIAVVMVLGFFLTELLDTPLYHIIAGFLILVPGIVLFVRFLQNHPLPTES